MGNFFGMPNLDFAIHQLRTELKVDPISGVGSTSIRGIARLADISDSGLAANLRNAAQLEPSNLIRFLMHQGFEPAQLAKSSETGIVDMLVAAIYLHLKICRS